MFALGARVDHPVHGPGRVVEHMDDGRTRVNFDNGESHRYRPESLNKLSTILGFLEGSFTRLSRKSKGGTSPRRTRRRSSTFLEPNLHRKSILQARAHLPARCGAKVGCRGSCLAPSRTPAHRHPTRIPFCVQELLNSEENKRLTTMMNSHTSEVRPAALTRSLQIMASLAAVCSRYTQAVKARATLRAKELERHVLAELQIKRVWRNHIGEHVPGVMVRPSSIANQTQSFMRPRSLPTALSVFARRRRSPRCTRRHRHWCACATMRTS